MNLRFSSCFDNQLFLFHKISDSLSHLESQVTAGRSWRERASRVFLKKNSNMTLLDVLCPRSDLGNADSRRKKKQPLKDVDSINVIPHPIFAGMTQKELLDRKVIVKAFKEAEHRELMVRRHINVKVDLLI